MKAFLEEPYGMQLMEKAPKLKRLIERYKIPVIITDKPKSLRSFLMYVRKVGDEGKPIIVIVEHHLKAVGMTDDEVICILWHEAAHAAYNADEYEADRLAIDMTSFAIWKSAIRKINLCLQVSADVPEHPLYTHRDPMMIRGGVIHQTAGNQTDSGKPQGKA
jgi:hypothetical protein